MLWKNQTRVIPALQCRRKRTENKYEAWSLSKKSAFVIYRIRFLTILSCCWNLARLPDLKYYWCSRITFYDYCWKVNYTYFSKQNGWSDNYLSSFPLKYFDRNTRRMSCYISTARNRNYQVVYFEKYIPLVSFPT